MTKLENQPDMADQRLEAERDNTESEEMKLDQVTESVTAGTL